MSEDIQVLPSQAKEAIKICMHSGNVCHLTGSPGIGKSDIIKSVAKKFNLKVLDLRLSQCDPVDLMGFPNIDKGTGKSSYYPPDIFPLETDCIPEGYKGWLLFLDEFDSASRAVQASSYKIVLDKKVGNHNLHSKVFIVCAGNLQTDNAIVQELSTPMQSRLIHLELVPDFEEWKEWAIENQIDDRIVAFLSYRVDLLHKFDPNHNDHTFPSPRTWEFASNIIKKTTNKDILFPLLCGTIGSGAAYEFHGYMDVWRHLPSKMDLETRGKYIEIPSDMGVLYAVANYLYSIIEDTNTKAIIGYMTRLPIEFQVVAMRRILKAHPIMEINASIKEWINNHGQSLM